MPDQPNLAHRIAHRVVRSVLDHVPLNAWERIVRKDVICVNYHVVSENQVPHVRHYAYKTPDEFRRDMECLADRYGFIDYAELSKHRNQPPKRRGKTHAFLTFDDGFSECFDVVRPVLLEMGIPASFFIVDNFIGNRHLYYEAVASLCVGKIENLDEAELENIIALVELPSTTTRKKLINWVLGLKAPDENTLNTLRDRLGLSATRYLKERAPYMTRRQLRQMASDGFTLGGHGMTHRLMTSLPEAELENDIVRSCAAIAELSGQSEVPFAFPWNGAGINRTLLADIRTRHPQVGLFFDTYGLWTDAPHIIQRISGDSRDGIQRGKSNLPELIRSKLSQRRAW